jgi:hypothetical protein
MRNAFAALWLFAGALSILGGCVYGLGGCNALDDPSGLGGPPATIAMPIGGAFVLAGIGALTISYLLARPSGPSLPRHPRASRPSPLTGDHAEARLCACPCGGAGGLL